MLKKCLFAILLIGALTGLGSAALRAGEQAGAGERVRISAKFDHDLLPAGEPGRAYIRIGIQGLALPRENERAPVNIALVIDRSGSMQGLKIEQARQAALMALDRLEPQDNIAVVAYNHTVNVVIPMSPADDLPDMRRDIETISASGRTALYAGTVKGMDELQKVLDDYRVNRVILLSDGLANVGPSSPRALAKLGRKAGGKGISITTIGLGLGYNEDLMTQLALASDGNHAFVEDPEDLVAIFDKEFGDVLSVVAKDAEIGIDFPEGLRPIRVLGREAEIDGQHVRFGLRQLYGGQEKYILVEVEVAAHAPGEMAAPVRLDTAYVDVATKKRGSARSRARLGFSADPAKVKASMDRGVMTAVARQVATERNAAAVKLRDSGKVEEARKVLRDNAAYLKKQAGALSAPGLDALSAKNMEDAKAVAGPQWNKQRKEMRARQYKDKTQQAY